MPSRQSWSFWSWCKRSNDFSCCAAVGYGRLCASCLAPLPTKSSSPPRGRYIDYLFLIVSRTMPYTDIPSLSQRAGAPGAVQFAVCEEMISAPAFACLTVAAAVLFESLRLGPYSCVRPPLLQINPIVHGCGASAASTIASSTAAGDPSSLLAAAPALAVVPACRQTDVAPTPSTTSMSIAGFNGRRVSGTRDTIPTVLSPLNPPAPSSALLVSCLATGSQHRCRMSGRRSPPPWRLLFPVLFLGAAALAVRRTRSR